MRRFLKIIVPAVAVGLLAVTMPAEASARPRVPAPLFGQHVGSIASEKPSNLARVGSIRLWDSGVTWREVEFADDQYDWAKLDAAVDNAQALGASEIMYTLGSTPQWAASDPDSKGSLYGPGTNSHPADNAYYTDYLKAVATRYKGRITSYQMWNEANLTYFYLGSTKQMAKLTRAASKALRSVDPDAKLVAASTTVRSTGLVGKWGRNYGKAMRKTWKYVDAVSTHFYPPSANGPGTRIFYIKLVQKYYEKWGAKNKPLWDTEINYGDRREFLPTVKKTYKGKRAAAYVARTYIDSMRLGVKRVFWYSWDSHILGTDMVSQSDQSKLTTGGRAFLEVQDWMVGAKWYGCRTKKRITTCTVKPRGEVEGLHPVHEQGLQEVQGALRHRPAQPRRKEQAGQEGPEGPHHHGSGHVRLTNPQTTTRPPIPADGGLVGFRIAG